MSSSAVVPNIRFKEFESEWTLKKIRDISTVTSGGTPSTSVHDYWGGDILWMNSGELNLKNVFDVENRITQKGLENSSAKLIPSKSVLIGLAGQGKTRGTAAINMVELCTNQSIAAIYPNEQNFVSEFLYFEMDRRYAELRRLSTGEGGRGGLNLQIIKSITLFFPCLNEQRKISHLLSEVDKKISLIKQKHALLQRYKKGVIQKLFSRKFRFKDDNGNDFPDWTARKFGDFIHTRSESPSVENEYPLYSLTIENGILPKSTRYVREFLVNDTEDAYKVVRPNDFALNPMNLRFGAIAKHHGDETVLLSKYYDVFYCDETMSSNFFEAYLQSYSMIHFYNRMATGSLEEKKRVHYSEFIHFKKNLPCVKEQIKIAEFLEALDNKTNLTAQQIQLTQTFKKGLLQQMFL